MFRTIPFVFMPGKGFIPKDSASRSFGQEVIFRAEADGMLRITDTSVSPQETMDLPLTKGVNRFQLPFSLPDAGRYINETGCPVHVVGVAPRDRKQAVYVKSGSDNSGGIVNILQPGVWVDGTTSYFLKCESPGDGLASDGFAFALDIKDDCVYDGTSPILAPGEATPEIPISPGIPPTEIKVRSSAALKVARWSLWMMQNGVRR